jgi:hypothetical protein
MQRSKEALDRINVVPLCYQEGNPPLLPTFLASELPAGGYDFERRKSESVTLCRRKSLSAGD